MSNRNVNSEESEVMEIIEENSIDLFQETGEEGRKNEERTEIYESI